MIPAASKQKASVMSLSTVDERQALDDEYNEVRLLQGLSIDIPLGNMISMGLFIIKCVVIKCRRQWNGYKAS